MATHDTSGMLPPSDTVPVIREHVAITPGVCGGRARIAGHRIRVQDIVIWHEQWGQTVDEIVARFPQLTLGDVHAALAYYDDHRAEIRAQIAADDERAERARRETPSKIAQKIADRMSTNDPLSPG